MATLIEDDQGNTPIVTIGDEDVLVGQLGSYVAIKQNKINIIAIVTRMIEQEALASPTIETPGNDVARRHAVRIHFIQPGKPAQNGFVERFNRTYREDVLDVYIFNSLDEARRITFEWLEEYNSIRPHAALGNKTPYEYFSNLESVYL